MATVTEPVTSTPGVHPPETGAILPLENGDRLSRAEFERRYDAMPHIKDAELIEGVVYMGSPVGHAFHGKPHGRLSGWFDRYVEGTEGVEWGDNSSIRLDPDSMPQPDAFLYILPECGGRFRVGAGDIAEGAPELVAEVGSSSASIDLHAKKVMYQRHGVREYLVYRTRNKAVDWFALRDGVYQPLAPDADGLIRSEVFPGLWLDVAALLRGDRRALSAALRLGLDSPEHAAFLDSLAKARTPAP